MKDPIAQQRRILEPEVARSEAELREAVRELQEAVRQRVDPRLVIGEHPYVAIGAAFCAGLAIALLTRKW